MFISDADSSVGGPLTGLHAVEHPGAGLLARATARVLRRPGGMFGIVVLGILLLLAIFAPVVVVYDPLEIGVDILLNAPSLTHPFGTNDLGRDVL